LSSGESHRKRHQHAGKSQRNDLSVHSAHFVLQSVSTTPNSSDEGDSTLL
jgi:hypothetical protein